MKNFILGSFITFLLSVCVYFYITNTSLTARINTYKTDKNIINKDFQKAKEDYFIQQQSDNTSLILFTVTSLFALFGTITFVSVISEFKTQVKKINKKYAEQVTKYEESVIHINNLRSNFNLQFAEKINNDFGKVLLERPLDIPKLIELGLMSCQNYCYAIGYNSYNSDEFNSIITSYITVTLDVMVEKVNLVEKVELKNISYAQFLAVKSSFDLTLEKDNLQKFSIIFGKLSFPTLD